MNTEEKIKALENRVRQLEEADNLLKSSTTIPFNVDQAFRARFSIDNYTSLDASAKSATSENQAVNEGGAASYSVLKAPDGFREATLSGVTFYFPYYT